MRRLKQPPVADFRNLQFMFGLSPIGDVMENQHDADDPPAASTIGAALSSIGHWVPSRAMRTVWFAKPDDRAVADGLGDRTLHRWKIAR